MFRYFKRVLPCIVLLTLLLHSPVVYAEEVDKPTLYSVRMFNVNKGWGIARTVGTDSVMIVKTDDGGKTWHTNLTRPDSVRYSSFYFLDLDHAWASFGHMSTIWYTHDGGQSWHEVDISSALYGLTHGMLRFIDKEHGWFLGLNCCAAGNEYATLYQTSDGGKSWKVINDADQDRGLGSSYHTGFEVADNQIAWMTLASIGGYGGIDFTRDGGRNWEYNPLPVPAGEEKLQGCDMLSPFVFSRRLVTFVANCIRNNIVTYLYHTTNAGRTWQIIRIPVNNNNYRPYIYMINQLIGWYVVEQGEAGRFLYQTEDGGQHWTKLSMLPDKVLSDASYPIFFLNQRVGWAVANDGTLFKTDDGGRTWTIVPVNLITEPS